jgi:hypothetical protein
MDLYIRNMTREDEVLFASMAKQLMNLIEDHLPLEEHWADQLIRCLDLYTYGGQRLRLAGTLIPFYEEKRWSDFLQWLWFRIKPNFGDAVSTTKAKIFQKIELYRKDPHIDALKQRRLSDLEQILTAFHDRLVCRCIEYTDRVNHDLKRELKHIQKELHETRNELHK